MDKNYITPMNIAITAYKEELNFKDLSFLEEEINNNKGALFSSNYEFPNRYSRWELGVVNPYLEIRTTGLQGQLRALSISGKELLKIVNVILQKIDGVNLEVKEEIIKFTLEKDNKIYREEERSKKRSIFTIIRALMDAFKSEDNWLGLYGAFGYDLVFQFEDDIKLYKSREDSEDVVLYFPEKIYLRDNKLSKTFCVKY